MSLSAATAAPAPITINNRAYSATPLDFLAIGELEQWARGAYLAVACKGLVGLPDDQRRELYDRALDKATGIDFESAKFVKYLRSPTGMATLLSMSLRARHPEMSVEAVAREFTGKEAELVPHATTILRISGLAGDEKGGQKPGEGEKGEGPGE
jgi:hypothetical protein